MHSFSLATGKTHLCLVSHTQLATLDFLSHLLYMHVLLMRSSTISLEFTVLGEIFAYVTFFFFFFINPTIGVVTFCLNGWCMLGVYLLPAFTRLGHECQDLLSLCDGMHACTDWTSVYTLIQKSFGGMEPELMLTPREKSPLLEQFSSE